MVKRKFTPEQIGRFKEILDLGWSLRRTRQHFLDAGLGVSVTYLSQIRSGKDRVNRITSKKRPGPQPKLSASQVLSILKRVDNSNPPSERDLASMYNVSQTTINKTIKKYGRRVVKKPQVHAMSDDTIEKRYKRSWNLYRLLRKNRWMKVVTCDEAWFYLKDSRGKTSIQYLRANQKRNQAEVLTRVTHSKGVMVWIAFCADGFFIPIFVTPGAKIDSDYYCSNVIKPFYREYIKRYPDNNLLFHQDSAPAHVSRKTTAFMDSLRLQYITKHQWMPSSPDCSPCDYWLFGYLKNRMKRRKAKTINGLKKVLKDEVKKIPLTMIHNALRSWPRRCRLVYYNKGHNIENLL